MINEARAVQVLKVFLAGLFFLFTVLQTLSFPGQFAYMAKTSPADSPWRWPLTIAVGFIFLCAQVVIISIWQLLNLIKSEEFFTNKSIVLFNRILKALLASIVFPIAFLIFLLIMADDPGMPMVVTTFTTALGVIILLTYILKTRTQKAIELINKN